MIFLKETRMQDRSTIKTLGGSDAQRIAAGDWYNLWAEKTGRQLHADLSDVFRVQLGILTERFHLEWIKKAGSYTNMLIPRDGAQSMFNHPTLPLHVTPDAILAGPQKDLVVEVKHSNGRNTFIDAVQYYSPQLQHGMYVMGTKETLFSVICGNDGPFYGMVEFDPDYADKLIELELKFMGFVERDEEPPRGGNVPVFKEVPAALRVVDMSSNNAWAVQSAIVVERHAAEKELKAAKEEMKALFPDDCRQAHGCGVTITRNAKGSLVLTLA